MSDPKVQLVNWLDDLCVRFIINLPHEELRSVERICFQIEEAQWFYEDFIRPLEPNLPSMNLRRFSMLMFKHCPLTSSFSEEHHNQAYEDFLAYKTRVPVRGAILLNDDMTEAVLVKGWKKGAKWSFPRGKINKDEADLDCAVREVFEETGYNLKEAGLVKPEEDMKKIAVSMREQNMQLYVFRGVPMDTYFEPRTRKEISKIDWYKLSDLPTIRKKNQVQQGTGNDLIKDNSFYMVAPFLAPLKHWIKEQRRQDRRRKTPSGQYLVPPGTEGPGLTEDDIQGETTADEGLAAQILPGNEQRANGSFEDLVARLGRSHRTSDALPEVTVLPQAAQVYDPAEELKRLLSVGLSSSSQLSQMEAPSAAQPTHTNQLLAMLQGSKPSQPEPPRTPYDQIIPPQPQQPKSPHGQHHPRPPHLENMPPPPTYGFQPQHPSTFRSPHSLNMQPQHLNGSAISNPRHFIPHHPQQNPAVQSHGPSNQEAFSQQRVAPYQQTGDPQFAPNSQYPELRGGFAPPASRLPIPELTDHALGLLNAFKSNEKVAPTQQQTASQPQQNPQGAANTHPPALQSAFDSYISPSTLPSANPYAPSPPPFQSPPSMNVQTVQPKPRNAHQDSLLNLFRSPSVSAATPSPPNLGLGPIELSAQPNTPGHSRLPSAARATGLPKPDLTLKPILSDPFSQPKKPEITSATVSGPVNVPDFDTVKKHSHPHDMNGHGHSRGPSPAGASGTEQMSAPSIQILKRHGTPSIATIESSHSKEVTRSRSPRARSPKVASNETTPLATQFKPSILRRPQQSEGLVASPPIQPATTDFVKPTALFHPKGRPQAQPSFDRREAQAPDQKSALLSLFGKPSQVSTSPLPMAASPIPPQPLYNTPSGLPSLPIKTLPRSPVPPSRSPQPQPPTPKSIVSGVISPVSPLPADKGSAAGSPAHLASRSRISSIGEEMQTPVPIAKPSVTSHPAAPGPFKNGIETALGNGARSGGGSKETKSPVDKTFLLGLLGDMARKGR